MNSGAQKQSRGIIGVGIVAAIAVVAALLYEPAKDNAHDPGAESGQAASEPATRSSRGAPKVTRDDDKAAVPVAPDADLRLPKRLPVLKNAAGATLPYRLAGDLGIPEGERLFMRATMASLSCLIEDKRRDPGRTTQPTLKLSIGPGVAGGSGITGYDLTIPKGADASLEACLRANLGRLRVPFPAGMKGEFETDLVLGENMEGEGLPAPPSPPTPTAR